MCFILLWLLTFQSSTSQQLLILKTVGNSNILVLLSQNVIVSQSFHIALRGNHAPNSTHVFTPVKRTWITSNCSSYLQILPTCENKFGKGFDLSMCATNTGSRQHLWGKKLSQEAHRSYRDPLSTRSPTSELVKSCLNLPDTEYEAICGNLYFRLETKKKSEYWLWDQRSNSLPLKFPVNTI